jgi:hypothetical protein
VLIGLFCNNHAIAAKLLFPLELFNVVQSNAAVFVSFVYNFPSNETAILKEFSPF